MKRQMVLVKLSLLFLLGQISTAALANEAVSVADKPFVESSAVNNLKPVHLLVTYGSETRAEKNSNNQWQQPSYNNYSLAVSGFGESSKNWLFSAEKSEFEEHSGTNVLSVQRTFEDYLLFVDYRSSYTLSGSQRASWWQQLYPFMGFGAGAYRQTVETSFVGQRKMDETDFRFLSAVHLGLTWQLPLLWLSAEGRVLFGDEMQQQPTLGALFRVGFWL